MTNISHNSSVRMEDGQRKVNTRSRTLANIVANLNGEESLPTSAVINKSIHKRAVKGRRSKVHSLPPSVHADDWLKSECFVNGIIDVESVKKVAKQAKSFPEAYRITKKNRYTFINQYVYGMLSEYQSLEYGLRFHEKHGLSAYARKDIRCAPNDDSEVSTSIQ